MSRESERALLEAAQRGDMNAFAALWKPHKAIIKAFLFRLGCAPDDLEDLVQECALRALKNIRKFKATCAFSSWLCRLAVSARADLFRQSLGRRKDRVPRKTVNLQDAETARRENVNRTSLEEESGRRLFLEKLDRKLTARERQVVALLERGLKVREIAAELPIKVATVYYVLNRVKEKARQLLMEKKSEQPRVAHDSPRYKFTSAGT
jgi:RNA polymerase sigma-70 factor (ECF subfamily)